MDVPSDSMWPDAEHFDHLAPELAASLHETLAHMRSACPVAYSTRRGGFWVVTRYADVVQIAKDWATFSSAHGVSPGASAMTVKAIPEHVDPPLHRAYKRLINVWFTPQAMARLEVATRELVTQLIDGFIAAGHCEFMGDFARPFPSRSFFELVLGAPPEEAAYVGQIVMKATDPTNPDSKRAWPLLVDWIKTFLNHRRKGSQATQRNDVVDAILHGDIEGRPVTEEEVLGMVQLLLLGGLDTTAGALGAMLIRLAEAPTLFAQLQAEADRIPDAIEESLRLDGPFIAIGRTAMTDAEIGGQHIKAGDKVLIYWAAANRDPAEFPDPNQFQLNRINRRHVAFGAGPHTCAGLSLARMNMRIALEELTQRLDHLRLDSPRRALQYHSGLTRFPLAVPIRFSERK